MDQQKLTSKMHGLCHTDSFLSSWILYFSTVKVKNIIKGKSKFMSMFAEFLQHFIHHALSHSFFSTNILGVKPNKNQPKS